MIDPTLQRGEFLVSIDGTATALCPDHAQAFAVTAMLLELNPDVYEIGDQDPGITCQTCYMIDIARRGEKPQH